MKSTSWVVHPRYGRARQTVTAGIPLVDELGQLIDELEPVDDEWLAKFAETASPFIEEKRVGRKLREDKAHAERGFSRARKERI